MRPRSNTRFKVSSSLRTAPGSDESESNGGSPLATSDNDSSNKLKKRSWPSRNEEPPLKARRQSEDRYSPRPSLNRLHIQQVQSKASTGDSVGMEHSSPWKNFKPGFPLSLEDLVIIAGGKDGYLVAVREISGRDPDEKIGMLQRIQCEGGNKNLLALRGSFSSEGKRYAVFEHEYFGEEDLFHKDMFKLSINLTQFALNGPYATEQQLAMILGQVSPPGSVRSVLMSKADS
jgi:hypothetical protein